MPRSNPSIAKFAAAAALLTGAAHAQNFHVEWTYNSGAENDTGGYSVGDVDVYVVPSVYSVVTRACAGFFGESTDPATGVDVSTKDGSNFMTQQNGTYSNLAHYGCVANPDYTDGSTTQAKLIPSPAVPLFDTTTTPQSGERFAKIKWFNKGVTQGLQTSTSYGWTYYGMSNYLATANALPQSQRNNWAETFVDQDSPAWPQFTNFGNQPDETPYTQPACPCTCAPSSTALLLKKPSDDLLKGFKLVNDGHSAKPAKANRTGASLFPSRKDRSMENYFKSTANRQYKAA